MLDGRFKRKGFPQRKMALSLPLLFLRSVREKEANRRASKVDLKLKTHDAGGRKNPTQVVEKVG